MSHARQDDDDNNNDDHDDGEIDPFAQYCARLLVNFKINYLMGLQKVENLQQREQAQQVTFSVRRLEAWLENYFKVETTQWIKDCQDEIIIACTHAYTSAESAVMDLLVGNNTSSSDGTSNGGGGEGPSAFKQQADKIFIDSLHNAFDAAYAFQQRITAKAWKFIGYGNDNDETTSNRAILRTASVEDHQQQQQNAHAAALQFFMSQAEDIYYEHVLAYRRDQDESPNVLGIPVMTESECVDFMTEATVPPIEMSFVDDGRATTNRIRNRKVFLSEDGQSIYWPQCYTSYYLYVAHMLRAYDIRKRLIESNAQRLAQEDGIAETVSLQDIEAPSYTTQDAIQRMFRQQDISEQRSRNFLASAALDSDGNGGAVTRTEADMVILQADASREGRTKFQNWVLEHVKFFFSNASNAVLNKMDLFYDVISIGPFDAFNEADVRISKRLPAPLLRNGYMSGLAEPAHMALLFPGFTAEYVRYVCSLEVGVSVVRPDFATMPPVKYIDLGSVMCPNGQILEIDTAVEEDDDEGGSVEFRFYKASAFAAIAPLPSSRSSSPAIPEASGIVELGKVPTTKSSKSSTKKKSSRQTSAATAPQQQFDRFYPEDINKVVTVTAPKDTVNNIATSLVDSSNQQVTV